MRHIREVLRLHYSVGMSQRAVARSLGLAQGTISKYVNRARRAGLTWPLPTELDDDVQLENRLFPPLSDRPSNERPHPDWALVHRELRRPNVTLMPLGRSIAAPTPTASAMRGSANATGNGLAVSSQPCARFMSPVRAVRRLFRPHHGGG